MAKWRVTAERVMRSRVTVTIEAPSDMDADDVLLKMDDDGRLHWDTDDDPGRTIEILAIVRVP